MSFDLTRALRPEVRALTAYHAGPGPSGRPVKLDANESPFLLGEAIRGELAAELAAALGSVELHRYPDPEARELKALLARELRVPAEQLLATNGSDEGIHLLLSAAVGPVLAPVPTFVMYELGARALARGFVGVPLMADFRFDLPGFLKGLEQARPTLVFLAWPNNPTGGLIEEEALEAILRACAGSVCHALVVVDEAYTEYSGRTVLSWLGRHPNLVILRTLSKIGLAGIRLGMLIAAPALVVEIDKIRPPYNVNALSQAAARVVLAYGEVVARHAATIVAERERILAALAELAGATAFPSRANFFLLRTARPGDRVFQGLLERGILVRNFSRAPYLADCLRVTVGTPEENDAFLAALRAVLEAER
ncbi:MAG: histidinol-phosphate transaminase [candidate division NC10 bacterium]|nr:histidinol-phosphate transaminase [candidate division NC10 bacterium]